MTLFNFYQKFWKFESFLDYFSKKPQLNWRRHFKKYIICYAFYSKFATLPILKILGFFFDKPYLFVLRKDSNFEKNYFKSCFPRKNCNNVVIRNLHAQNCHFRHFAWDWRSEDVIIWQISVRKSDLSVLSGRFFHITNRGGKYLSKF